MKPYPSYKNSGIEWIGKIPTHWRVMPAFAIFKEQCFRNRSLLEKNLLSLSYGKIVRKDFEANYGLLPESFETYQIVRPNNIILRLTDLQNDKRSLRVGLVKEKGIITSAYLCLYPKNINSEYAYTLLHSYDILKVFYAMGSGIRQNMSFKDLKRLPILVPPIEEQKTITHFIDRKLEEIYHFIRNKQRLIELLYEQKTAIINRAVTRGINPYAPMKHSGIEWLGEIPAHWEITKLKYAASHIVDCPHSTPIYSDNEPYHVIRTADISHGCLNLSKTYRVNESEYIKRIERLRPISGDIVYSREGERYGIAASVPPEVDVCLGQRMMHFRAGSEFNSRFLMWQLNASSTYCQALQDTLGATSPHVNVETIRNYRLLMPPLEEQERIADYIDLETNKIHQAIAQAEKEIELIQEYRTTLISDAVTGKIDVRPNSLVEITLTA